MLGRIMQLWRGKNLVSQMLDEFMEMLELGGSMFDSVITAGLSGASLDDIREDFYAKDQQINQLEQSIRRKIIVHLSVQPGADVPMCLVLMAVSRDAERLGDFAKNIFQVFERVPALEPGLYYDQLIKLSYEISDAFKRVADVFRQSDAQAARRLWEENYRLEKQCDAVINELLGGAEVDAPVAYTLLYRFLKRILTHQSNIVSSVVMPVDKLQYYEKGGAVPSKPSAQPV